MANEKPEDSKVMLEKALEGLGETDYVMRLYIAGLTPKSTRAIENIKKICDEYLKGRYELEVIDIHQQPDRAREAQIIAVPTLIKQLPLPLRKLIGDMTNKDRVIIGLDMRVKK